MSKIADYGFIMMSNYSGVSRSQILIESIMPAMSVLPLSVNLSFYVGVVSQGAVVLTYML